MRFTITYNQLFAIEQDINAFSKQAPGLSFLLAPKINLFYQRAAMHLKGMHMSIERIQRKFAEVDENDQLIKQGENSEIKFKDAVTDGDKTYLGPEVEKVFRDEINILMSRSVVIDM